MRSSRLLVLGLAAGCSAETAPEHPHVVLIVADDLGWNDVGFHGAPFETPRIDGLAEEGVIFDRFYAHPVCSPTRAALLGGRDPMRDGFIYGALRPWDTRGYPRDRELLPEILRTRGYRTALVGKWHLGHGAAWQQPNRRGFDHFYGHLTGAVTYFGHERAGVVDWQRNGTTVQEEGYATDLLGDEAVRLIEDQDPGQPLFLMLSFNAPHTPLQAPAEAIAAVEGLDDDPDRRVYAAMVERMDRQIGRVLDALEQRGMAEHALVFFLSDNGGSTGNGARNAPLRGGKHTTFEGGIRTVAVARWPGVLEGGRTSLQRCRVLDVPGLVLEAAGAAPPEDWDTVAEPRAVLGAGAPRPREDFFFAVKDPRRTWVSVIRDDWKLVQRIRHHDGEAGVALYHLGEDPRERDNRAVDEPERVAELRAACDAWRATHPPGADLFHQDHPPPGWTPPRDWAE